MINLEELCLNICVDQRIVFDGNQLKTNILNHFSKLNKLTLNIRSLFHPFDPVEFVSHEDIRNSLIDLPMTDLVSYLDYTSNKRHGQFHMFSYPYTLDYFDGITNRFPNGLFQSVRKAKLHDDHPFEHEFFRRMAKAFPLLEMLTLTNETAQQQKSIDNDQDLALIEYSHLTELFFNCAHDDYIEQFLMNSKTFLSKSIWLCVDREDLKRVTHNFTRISTQINCAKVEYLYFLDDFHMVEQHVTKYFPHATIKC